MANRLSGKVALVTGSGSGIGAATARLYAEEGARVVVNDIVEERAEKVAASIRSAGGEALISITDVSSASAVTAMFEKTEEEFGGLDILVNNAFRFENDTTIVDLEEEAWDRTMEVCLKGPFLCTRGAIPLMKHRNGGSVITISSVNALLGVGETAYTAAKGGLISMMRLVAAEYGEWQIRSNVICPATISTKISMDYWSQFPTGFAKLKEMYPLGRIGVPEDVASAALYLASDESSWVSGTVQVVDGGLMSGRKFEEK